MATASLSSRSGKSDGQREAFGAFISDDASIKTITPIVSEFGWSTERIQGGGIANAVRSLSVMTSPEFLVVDLSDCDDPLRPFSCPGREEEHLRARGPKASTTRSSFFRHSSFFSANGGSWYTAIGGDLNRAS